MNQKKFLVQWWWVAAILLAALLLLLAIWRSQQRVNVINRELKQQTN